MSSTPTPSTEKATPSTEKAEKPSPPSGEVKDTGRYHLDKAHGGEPDHVDVIIERGGVVQKTKVDKEGEIISDEIEHVRDTEKKAGEAGKEGESDEK